MSNYNPYYMPYYPQPQLQPQAQPQGQTIQRINPQNDEQVICYSVKNVGEISSIKAMPFTSYIGINEDAHEIYLRKMRSDGTVGTDTYRLAAEKQEKTDMQIISEHLANIEQKLNSQVIPDFLKGENNGK